MLFLGVVFVLLSSILSVIGVTLQKIALTDKKQTPSSERRRKSSLTRAQIKYSEYYDKRWVAGMLLYIVSQPMYAMSLVMCPFCIVAPLNCTGILISSMASSIYLGEKWTKLDVMSVLLGLFGTVGVLAYGPEGQDFQTGVENCKMLLTFWLHPRPRFAILFMSIVASICSYFIYKDQNAAVPHAIACATTSAFGGILLKVLTTFVSEDFRIPLFNPMFLAALVLFTVACVATIWLLGLGTKKYNNRYFMPAVNMLFSLILQFFGAVAFREFEDVLLAHCIICFLFSCVCFASVCIAAIGSEDTTRSSAVNMNTTVKEMGQASDFMKYRFLGKQYDEDEVYTAENSANENADEEEEQYSRQRLLNSNTRSNGTRHDTSSRPASRWKQF